MNALTEALRTTADDAPTRVDLPDPVGAAWRRGRRRRTVTRVGGAVTVLVVLALVVGLVGRPFGGLPRAVVPAGEARDGVHSYPQRLGHQWWTRDLPSNGGPLAGVVAPGQDGSTWQAVGDDGTRYSLAGDADPEIWAAVSPDGWRIAWMQARFGRWVIQDRRTGGLWFPQTIGSQTPAPAGNRAREHLMQMQSPAFFSPDGLRLAVLTIDGPVVYDTVDGSERVVPGMDQAAGWLDDDHLVGRTVPSAGDGPLTGVDVVEWDARTDRTATLGRLRLPRPAAGTEHVDAGQWWGTVRSDGTLWVLGSDASRGGGPASTWIAGFGLPSLDPVVLDGSHTARVQRVDMPDTTSPFGLRWLRDEPLSPFGDTTLGVAAGRDSGRPVVVSQDPMLFDRAVWAQDALDGGPRWTLFGTSTWQVTWWWREIGLAALVLLAWRLWWRRRLGPGANLRLRAAPRDPAATRRSAGGR